MITQLHPKAVPPRLVSLGTSAVLIAVLSACVNYAGIHSDHQMSQPQAYESSQSLVSERGNWPAPDWADQFGDPQLHALLDEALKGNPSLDQARARVAAAAAYTETARANTLPQVGASYSFSREQYSGTAAVPPPFGGSWQSENVATVNASYNLDL